MQRVTRTENFGVHELSARLMRNVERRRSRSGCGGSIRALATILNIIRHRRSEASQRGIVARSEAGDLVERRSLARWVPNLKNFRDCARS